MISTGQTNAGTKYQLESLTEGHIDDYALQIGSMYAEFSAVQWTDHVLLLLSGDGGGYVSVRHDVPDSDRNIPASLRDQLLEIGQ